MSAEAHPGDCRNCGSPAPGAYCPACGQETALHPPSAREFLHEFVGHYIALEGALWRTLKALLVPGKLTLEYFAGRRRQYVLPLRLYLTASLLFFLVAKVIAPQADFRVAVGGDAVSAPARPDKLGNLTFSPTRPEKSGNVTFSCDASTPACRKVQEKLRERYGELSQAKLGVIVRDRLVAYSPYAMFFLLPIFAMLTRLAYRKRPFNYGEHLVFALHVHTFAFLAGAVAAIVGLLSIETLAAAIYLALALTRVFGGRAWARILRFLFIFVAYFVIVVLTVMAIAAAALLL